MPLLKLLNSEDGEHTAYTHMYVDTQHSTHVQIHTPYTHTHKPSTHTCANTLTRHTQTQTHTHVHAHRRLPALRPEQKREPPDFKTQQRQYVLKATERPESQFQAAWRRKCLSTRGFLYTCARTHTHVHTNSHSMGNSSKKASAG